MRRIAEVAIVALSLTTAALADDSACGDAPQDQWVSKQTIEQKATAMGYEVRSVKVEDGCYEVYGIDQNHKRVELYFDPVTAQIAKTKAND